MKINANDIKEGNVVEYEGELYIVAKSPEHVKPGKGPAYVQLELKNLKSGNKKNPRLSSSDTIEKAFLDTRDYQFLYINGDNLVLMEQENYEQIEVNKNMLGEKIAFLTDNIVLKVVLYENQPLIIELPQYGICEITETEPVIKGSTATASFKPAILDNGIRIKVPQYITQGEKVKVRTEDNSFVERIKG